MSIESKDAESPTVSTEVATRPMTGTDLRRLFELLRETYFPGRLRGYRVSFSRLPGIRDGDCNGKRRLIRLRPSLANEPVSAIRRVLLHEMAHVGNPSHGRAFRAAVRDLVERGAVELAGEADRYEDAVASPRAQVGEVRRSIEYAVLVDGYRGPWGPLVAGVARRNGLTVPQLLGVVPNLRKTYERAKRSAHAIQMVRVSRER